MKQENTEPQISKAKLIALLKSTYVNQKDDQNQTRYVYQSGRNMVVEYLLMEIAFGDLDAKP